MQRKNGDKRSDSSPRIYGLVEIPRKSTNLGPLLRCACAFGVELVVAIGYDKCSVEGSHGAAKHVQIVAFPTYPQAAAFLRNDLNCGVIFGLIGPLSGGDKPCPLITTTDTSLVTFSGDDRADARFISLPLNMVPEHMPTNGNIAVALSKHQRELPLPMAEICDVLLHVHHRSSPEGFPSRPLLDDVACLSILLHQLRQKSGYSEHSFDGHKYDVLLDRKQKQQEALAGRRQAERAARDKEVQQENNNGSGLWQPEQQGDY